MSWNSEGLIFAGWLGGYLIRDKLFLRWFPVEDVYKIHIWDYWTVFAAVVQMFAQGILQQTE